MRALNFFLYIAGALAVAVTFPSVIELLLVTTGAFRLRQKKNCHESENLSLAVIVPAHNEEALVGRCVRSLYDAAAHGPKTSVVVIADNCTDCTERVAREAGAHVLVRNDTSLRGKGLALRFAFDQLISQSFDGFVVVDADSIVSDNLLRELAGALTDGADAVQSRYRVAGPLNGRRKRLMDVALLAFNVLRPRGRDGYGLSAGILGNGFALSRQTLIDVPYLADSIVEDLEYHLLLVKADKRVVFADRATVYGDMPEDSAAQTAQRARWEGGRARVAKTNAPDLAVHVLHGKWRLLEPLLELLTLPLAYLLLVALLLCAIPVGSFRSYGLFVFGLTFLHVACSIALSGNAVEGFTALATAPGYIVWKVTKLAAITRSSRSDTPWKRTGRSGDVKEEARNA